VKSIAIADSSDASLLEQDTEHHGNPRAPYHRRARNPSSRTRHGSIYLHRAFLIAAVCWLLRGGGGGFGFTDHGPDNGFLGLPAERCTHTALPSSLFLSPPSALVRKHTYLTMENLEFYFLSESVPNALFLQISLPAFGSLSTIPRSTSFIDSPLSPPLRVWPTVAFPFRAYY